MARRTDADAWEMGAPVAVADAREPFVMVPSRLVREYGADVGLAAMGLYLVLGTFANNETGEAWPCMDTIAKLGGTERHRAGRLVRVLEDAGLVRTEARASYAGRRTSRLITLLPVPARAAPDHGTKRATDHGTNRSMDHGTKRSMNYTHGELDGCCLPSVSVYAVPVEGAPCVSVEPDTVAQEGPVASDRPDRDTHKVTTTKRRAKPTPTARPSGKPTARNRDAVPSAMREAVLSQCRLAPAALSAATARAVDDAARRCVAIGATPAAVAAAPRPGHWQDAPRPHQVPELVAVAMATAADRARAGVRVLYHGESGNLRRDGAAWAFLDCYGDAEAIPDAEARAMLAAAVRSKACDPLTADALAMGIAAPSPATAWALVV